MLTGMMKQAAGFIEPLKKIQNQDQLSITIIDKMF